MDCKHCKIKGNTTKYYYCELKEKSVDDYSCKNCLMKLPQNNFESIFGDFINKYKKQEM